MKKYALTCYALFAMIAVTSAQSPTDVDEQPKVRMALSVAPVLSWFNTDGNGDLVTRDGPRFNISYGLHADFSIGTTQNYYFSTGIFQTNTGGTLVHDYYVGENRDERYSTTTDFRINYVDIPLTLMLRTNEVGYIRYFGRVGADMGFNFKSTFDSQSVRKNAPTEPTSNLEDQNASDRVNLMRIGLHLELGFEFNLTGNTNAIVGVEWNNGLNNVFDKSYKIPKSDVTNEEQKVEGSINYLAVRVGVYF